MDEDTRLRDGPVPRGDEGQRLHSGEGQVRRSGLQGPVAAARAAATGCISDAAIERAIAALSICRDKIHFRKAKRLRLIATEACRAASNADGFRDRVAAETGIRLEVINRETEAALAVIGCSQLLDPKGRGAILFDIGGGSTELVRIERDPDEP